MASETIIDDQLRGADTGLDTGRKSGRWPASITPDIMEKALGYCSIVLLFAVIAAIVKGYAQWALLPWQLWLHLGTIVIALVITPVMMLRRRGDKWHRRLGWVWSASMLITAIVSFRIGFEGKSGFTPLYILSVLMLIQVPLLFFTARGRNIISHRRHARGMIIGGLLVAGIFTFPFNRLLGNWLFA
jgi:uncharacterized membrane protein